MNLNLRKITKFIDKTFIEGGKKAKIPVLLVSVAAVIKNPWVDRGFVEDLKPEILALAPKLGDILICAVRFGSLGYRHSPSKSHQISE